MRIRIFLLLLILILTIASVNAITSTETSITNQNLTALYRFEETNGHDSLGNFNPDDVGNNVLFNINSANNNLNNSWSIGEDQDGIIHLQQGNNPIYSTTVTDPFTFSWWMAIYSYNDAGGDENHIVSLRGTNQNWILLRNEGDNNMHVEFTSIAGGLEDTNLGTPVVKGEWNFYAISYDGTDAYLYINGSSVANESISGGWSFRDDISDVKDGFYLGGTSIATVSRSENATYDELAFYNSSLSKEEIQSLRDTGTIDGSSPPVVSDTINITITSPLDNTQYSQETLDFNYEIDSTTEYNCSLYINSTLNSSDNNNIAGEGVSSSFTSIPFNEGVFDYNITCTNLNETVGSSTNLFYIDYSDPIITDTFVNNTVYLNENISAWFNFSDNLMVYAYNISIDGDSVIYNNSIDSKEVYYNLTYDTSSLNPGEHSLEVYLADGHTAKELKNPKSYNPNNGLFNNYIEYDFSYPYKPGNIKISQKGGSLLDTWTTKEEKDRYSFKFKPNTKNNKYTFVVESSERIEIVEVEGSKYEKWLIFDEHWLDFMPYKNVDFVRISDTKVEVTIKGLKGTESEIEFNSIGDLNIVEKTYSFFTSNQTITYENNIFETDSQTIIFEINKTEGVTTDADLYWNGVEKTVSKSSFTNYDKYISTFNTPLITNESENVTLDWSYSLIGTENTETGNISNEQSIYQMSIDNCDTYTSQAINFTILDESTGYNLVGDIHATLRTFRGSSSSYQSDSFDYSGSSTYGICIYPSFAKYNLTSYSFEYLADGYATEEYMINTLEISNVSQNITLYLLNESSSSNVILTLKDTDDNLLEDYTVRVKRFYPETGEEITTEITETDVDGNALVHLVLNDVYYILSFEKDGEVIEIIDSAKYYTEAQTFIIDISVTQLTLNDKVSYSISPDSPVLSEPTNFTLTTISPGSYVEWFAIKSIYNGTTYLDNSTSADGGSVLLNIPLTNSTTWINLYYYIKVDGESTYQWTEGYAIQDFISGEYSIIGQQTGWEDSFSVLWRIMIAVVVSIALMLTFVPFVGPEAGGIIAILSQIIFMVIGWIPIYVGIIEAFLLFSLYLLMPRGGA